MFFKMLKNDLKAHKSLNIILFCFIVGASVISVVAANLMYTEIVGRPKTDKINNVANIVINASIGMGKFEEKQQVLQDWMNDSSMIEEGEIKEYARLAPDDVCINGVYSWDDSFPSHKPFHLTYGSSRVNLLYNDADKRFALASGEMAISYNLSDMTGIKRGDEIRITTQLGIVYGFRVAEIYKTPFDANSEELIICNADYEKIKAEMPLRFCKLLMRAGNLSYARVIRDELYDMQFAGKDLVRACSLFEYTPEIDSNYTIVAIISYFLTILSIMIIIIMMITIRYMMIAAIRQEEKEIGMMRAIGVDSFRYRWMFAATYITFAVIGGIAGITVGELLSKYVLKKFCKNIILRDPYMIQKIGLIVSISIVVLIIGFAAIMMRRIQKISVVEAIHGQNTVGRFDKFNRVDLYRSKKCRVPVFLAASDMINSFAKYSFLIISYMLATVILLTVFNMKSTLYSRQYQKSFLHVNRDFIFYIEDELADYYYQKGGDQEGAVNAFVEDVNKEGVPLSVRYMSGQGVTILRDEGEDIGATLWFGDTYNEGLPLRKGGKLPVHENEIMISYYTAKKEGLKIGDSLKVHLTEYDDDRIGTHEAERIFIITGFMDMMEEGYPEMVAGTEYTGAFASYFMMTNIDLNAPKSQHAALINKLKERFGEDHFRTYEENVKNTFSYVTGTIDALKIIFTVIMLFVLALNTTLYTTVDMSAETPGIAILKCVGFSEKDIRKWQMTRMLMILLCAILLGYLVEFTAIDRVAGKVFETFRNTGVHFVPNPLEAFVIIPAIIILIGTIVMRICVIKTKSINLWNIRED